MPIGLILVDLIQPKIFTELLVVPAKTSEIIAKRSIHVVEEDMPHRSAVFVEYLCKCNA
jgi:hypothetical protein